MFSSRKCLLAIALVVAGGAALAQKFDGVGRTATPAELKAWDIDVRPDLRGLPPGRGTVAQGQDLWEAKCAGCHGVFGESNEVFNPLVGGTTKDDIQTGRVATLTRPDYPGRTTLMKVPTVSTLWDYINRAMPWDKPKSLTADEVYAVTAFLLNLGQIVPDDFTDPEIVERLTRKGVLIPDETDAPPAPGDPVDDDPTPDPPTTSKQRKKARSDEQSAGEVTS